MDKNYGRKTYDFVTIICLVTVIISILVFIVGAKGFFTYRYDMKYATRNQLWPTSTSSTQEQNGNLAYLGLHMMVVSGCTLIGAILYYYPVVALSQMVSDTRAIRIMLESQYESEDYDESDDESDEDNEREE